MDRIEWLSTKQAATKLGIVLRTLYRLIDQGQLPAYRFGHVIRIKSSDLDVVLGSVRVVPGSLRNLYPASKQAGTIKTSGPGLRNENRRMN